MKFWRTIAAIALVGAFSTASALAAMAPKAPAAVGFAVSSGGGGGPAGINCVKSTEKTPVDGLTLCIEFRNQTNPGVGNGFPWENSSFFFATYRNQYLYPSSVIRAAAAVTDSIESIGARSVSFVGASVNVYGSLPNGGPSFIRIGDNVGGALNINFGSNSGPSTYCEVQGTDAAPIVIDTYTGPNGSLVSQCSTCADPTAWCVIGDITAPIGVNDNLMVDTVLGVGVGNSGASVWDTGSGLCPNGTRAYGSGSFANPNHLTTALAVDSFDFVWVFRGLAPPPPATVEQQIKEIVRLLLTPEGLRCSGLDLTSGNGRIEDDPIAFPDGANWDPVQPQVSVPGTAVTGDETVDGLRNAGFLP
jgi:uncharacterized protein YraI